MVTVRAVELSVHDTGGDGPPVVLLHGLAGHGEEWAGTRHALEGARRVVTLDQRAHGRSTRRPDDVSRAAYVHDVVALADRLGLDRITLVGQSMGGHTALLVAARYPDLVERLVLVESGVGGGGSALTDEVAAMLARWPVPFTDRTVAAEWFGGGRVGRAWADGLEAGPGGLWPRFDVDVLVRSLGAVHDHEAWEEWGGIGAPTLLVTGADGLVPDAEVERMLRTRPGVRHVVVDGAGHDLHLEAQDRWIDVLTTFLTDTE